MKKNRLIAGTIIFVLLAAIYYNATENLTDFFNAIGLTLALLTISYFTSIHLELFDTQSIKNEIVSSCLFFILLTLYCFEINNLISIHIHYSFIVILLSLRLVTGFWTHLRLAAVEKAVVIMAFITFLWVIHHYQSVPRTAIDLYTSGFDFNNSYEQISDLFIEEYKANFTARDYQEIKPLLDNGLTKRIGQYALFEYRDGQMIIVNTAHGDLDTPVQILDIKTAPEEVSTFFRQQSQDLARP